MRPARLFPCNKNTFLIHAETQKEQAMPPKLSQREKNLRGTAQKCRTEKVRSLRIVRRDIRELRKLITDIRYNLKLARDSVRTDGTLIEVLTTDSNGRVAKTKRLNPAFRVQGDSLKILKGLDRQMTLLSDEEEAAMAEQSKSSDPSDEFQV